jgi:hypothetical protein
MSLPEHGQRVEFLPEGFKTPLVGRFSVRYYGGQFYCDEDHWFDQQIVEWRGVDETEWRKIND